MQSAIEGMFPMLRQASISDCGRYRYTLTRQWLGVPARRCVFIMLNPSTADGTEDDPTIRRCLAFAAREGCNQLLVLNLFAFRATSPADLVKAADPVGELNDHVLATELNPGDDLVIAAWGAHPFAKDRARVVEKQLHGTLYCLGRTKSGAPRHPLYLPKGAPLEPFA